jgi:chromosome segregation ATPase
MNVLVEKRARMSSLTSALCCSTHRPPQLRGSAAARPRARGGEGAGQRRRRAPQWDPEELTARDTPLSRLRQQLEAASSERVAISARCEQLEAENQALRSGQSAVAALQRLANESARESSALSAQVSDFRARARAATSLLAQEQLAHQSTRVAYEELQRLFATTQQRIAAAAEPRGAGANSSDGRRAATR